MFLTGDMVFNRFGWVLWLFSFAGIILNMNTLWFVSLLGAVLLWYASRDVWYHKKLWVVLLLVGFLWLVWLLIFIKRGGLFG